MAGQSGNQNSDVVRVSLGASARDYICQQLALGGALANKLLQQSPTIVRIETCVTRGIPHSALHDFEIGGKARFKDTINVLAGYCQEFLWSHGQSSCAVFRHPLASPEDDFLARYKPDYFVLDSTVYPFLTYQHSLSHSFATVLKACRPFETVGFLIASWPNRAPPKRKQVVSTEFADKIVEHIEQVVVGAYDGESFLLATPRRGHHVRQ
ncbi:hypothetical protein D6833_01780 [Candidatus Parcubacteria bacterium]|nr:MAG: hypothetical protein D6833_01780 [Candidatus Parcubacteria bacterium]